MEKSIQEPSPLDYLEIYNQLEDISSMESFDILYYGSRERGDNDWNSDFNFYLLASTVDQMQPGFILKITRALKTMEKIAPVNLIAGDKETFLLRMNLFDPSIIHILERGTVFYGDHVFHGFQKIWNQKNKDSFPKNKLVPFLKRRKNFYANLRSRSDKENFIRMERVSTLDVHIWVIENISDITIQELVVLDMPKLSNEMIRGLYKNEWNNEIKQLLDERNHWRMLKRDSQSKELGLVAKDYIYSA